MIQTAEIAVNTLTMAVSLLMTINSHIHAKRLLLSTIDGCTARR
jgi:hypothetical protein